MKYRITLDCIFNDLDPMNDILEETKRRFPQAITITHPGGFQEKSFYTTQECHHDESSDIPCKVIEHAETP